MIAAAFLLLLGAQQGTVPAPLPMDTKPSPWADPVEDAENIPDVASIERTYKRAACVVDASGPRVAAALAKDYRTPGYKQAFAVILQNNGNCFGKRGGPKSASLTLTGAMAEQLLAQDRTALNVRLARAAVAPAPQTASEGEAAAICAVRSVPDDVAAWLRTVPGSPEDTAAAQPVEMVFGRCSRDPAKTKFAGHRLRALVALAALRSVNPASN